MANETSSLKIQSCSLEQSEPWKSAHKYSVTENYPLLKKQKYFWFERNFIFPKLDQTRNISRNLEVPWTLQGLWETKKLISCGYTRKAAGTMNQLQAKCESLGSCSASKETFGAQQNSVWFLRVCLSSSCQYCEHNNKFNQTHWQQLYCAIPGGKANYNILFKERLWSPWSGLR